MTEQQPRKPAHRASGHDAGYLLSNLVATPRQRFALERALSGRRLSSVAVALTRVVFSSVDRVRARAAAERVRVAVTGARAEAIRTLEREYRSPRFFREFGASATLTHDAFTRWSGVGEPALGALAIASVQRAGRVRELAVAELAELAAPAAYALLLVRLNDPVGAVARRAQQALEKWLSPARVTTLARYLPLVDSMSTWVRTTRRRDSLPARIYAQVSAHPQVLRAHSQHTDPAVRLSCYQLLFRSHRGCDSIASFLRSALADRNPRVRHRAAEVILDPQWTPPAVRPTLLVGMTNDRSPRIRARALRWLYKQPDAEVHVRRAVFDRNANVRFLARHYARRLDLGIPYRHRAVEILRAGTDERDQLIAALAMLSDHGRSDDCALVQMYRTYSIAAVRREAARTAGILECPEQCD